MFRNSSYAPQADRFGVLASATCTLHCLVGALLPVIVPTVGVSWLLGEDSERLMVALAVLGALIAATHAWKHNRRSGTVAVLAIGVVCLLASQFAEHFDGGSLAHGLSISAGIILVGGHIWNLRRFSRSALDASECCASDNLS